MSTSTHPDEVSLFNATTIAALTSLIAIISTAYFASLRLLPANTTAKLRTFYIWHLADSLVHLILESSFLYNCFFTYRQLSPSSAGDYPHPASLTAAGGYGPFLGRADRLYGPEYGNNGFAKLWQEYAKADKRWAGTDLTVISLELLTVGIGGPLAFYVSELIRRGGGRRGEAGTGVESAKLWFWGSLLATGELYGGFMTFAPEWLSGNANLDTSTWMKKWLYLVLFNMVWVFLPLWFLYEAYVNIKAVFVSSAAAAKGKKKA